MGTMKGGSNGGGGGGEIVQVQGGHIVRATGRKDRHSKVYTSKGPRDRRVRLSAHTAIQFYDVQDRLGFDRPSKAVDWLITKAKTSIENLSHLPPWHPNPQPPPPNHVLTPADQLEPPDCGGYEPSSGGGGGGVSASSFLPPPEELDSDSMKLFFPAEQTGQDLGLSLHSSNFHGGQAAASLFAAPEPEGFGGSGGAYQRLMGWPGGSSAGLGLQAENQLPRGSLPFPPSSSSGGFFLINQNMPSPAAVPQISTSSSSSSSRVPLQSSNLHLSPVPSSWLGGFDEFRRGGGGRFNISDAGLVALGFHNAPPHSTSPNSGHHH